MIPEWMNHVELVLLAVFLYVGVSSFLSSVIQCSVQKKMLSPDCSRCYPSRAVPIIEEKQEKLREEILPTLREDITEMKGDIKNILNVLNNPPARRRDDS